jgi:hypothetical protein
MIYNYEELSKFRLVIKSTDRGKRKYICKTHKNCTSYVIFGIRQLDNMYCLHISCIEHQGELTSLVGKDARQLKHKLLHITKECVEKVAKVPNDVKKTAANNNSLTLNCHQSYCAIVHSKKG